MVLIEVPSHAQPGKNAPQTAIEAGKHRPLAEHPSLMGYPQTL